MLPSPPATTSRSGLDRPAARAARCRAPHPGTSHLHARRRALLGITRSPPARLPPAPPLSSHTQALHASSLTPRVVPCSSPYGSPGPRVRNPPAARGDGLARLEPARRGGLARAGAARRGQELLARARAARAPAVAARRPGGSELMTRPLTCARSQTSTRSAWTALSGRGQRLLGSRMGDTHRRAHRSTADLALALMLGVARRLARGGEVRARFGGVGHLGTRPDARPRPARTTVGIVATAASASDGRSPARGLRLRAAHPAAAGAATTARGAARRSAS